MKVHSVEAVVRALNAAGVPFLIVGGMAVNAHGYGRLTQDMDVVIDLAPGTVRKVFAALAALGYRPRVPVTADAFADAAQRERWIVEKGMQVLAFDSEAHRETPVDLFVSTPFVFSTEHAAAVVEFLAPDVPVRIVRLETLLRMKEQAGRPVDVADVAELRTLHSGGTA